MEENNNRKHTRAGNRSRQSEKNFSRKSSNAIKNKPRYMKGLSYQGESSSFKDPYDKDSKPRVKNKKCVKLH